MGLKSALLSAQDTALCIVRVWWRPIMLVGVAIGTWVNLVIIPVVKWQVPNLAEAGAWIAACAGISWVREYGKVQEAKAIAAANAPTGDAGGTVTTTTTVEPAP